MVALHHLHPLLQKKKIAKEVKKVRIMKVNLDKKLKKMRNNRIMRNPKNKIKILIKMQIINQMLKKNEY